jgi:glucoamylase
VHPGAASFFDLARKDCVGTARITTSKVWFTVADGVLSDVYEPTIDNTNVKSVQYVVTDGSSFTDLQTRDLTYAVATDPTRMSCTITATSVAHGYQLVTTYVADAARDAVLMHTQLRASAGTHTNVNKLHVYAYLDAHVNGNGGGGTANGGGDTGVVDASGVGVIGDSSTVSQATNRDYAVPTFMALTSPQLQAASVGYAGAASDGLTPLDHSHSLDAIYQSAPNGHVVLTEQLKSNGGANGPATLDLSLGFGRTQAEAVAVAKASTARPFGATAATYLAGWAAYDAKLVRPKLPVGSVRATTRRRPTT